MINIIPNDATDRCDIYMPNQMLRYHEQERIASEHCIQKLTAVTSSFNLTNSAPSSSKNQVQLAYSKKWKVSFHHRLRLKTETCIFAKFVELRRPLNSLPSKYISLTNIPNAN